jgi:DNA-binding response OmpR family regulator
MRAIEILVVTSDPRLAARLDAALARQGAVYRIAADPAAAIHSLVEERPAVVVVDRLYGAMDPLLIIHRAGACAGLAAPAVILLAASADAEDPWLAGVDTLLDRDLDAAALARMIGAHTLAV